MIRVLVSIALRAVPREWRDDVARDLAEERFAHGAGLRVVLHTLAIGARLRLARFMDRRRSVPTNRRTLKRSFPMQGLVRDVRMAFRGAVRRPAYSMAIIATLAIGIGANTAIYSMFNWILFRPLPGVQHPADLVTIKFQIPTSEGSYFISFRDYAELRGVMTQSVSGIAAAVPMDMQMAAGASTTTVSTEVVASNYFDVLRVHPAMGRAFTPGEEAVGGPASVIISTGLWRRLFDADRGAIGKTLTLNGRTFTIVGVAPASFQGRSIVTSTDAWLPISSYATLLPSADAKLFLDRRQTFLIEAFARLRDGVAIGVAQAEATAAMTALPDFANRSKRTGPRAAMGPVLYPGLGHDRFVLERLGPVFWLLMGAVGLLLLLACANAANLLLARAAARGREISVCQAIGASRLQIVRQQIVEGLLLSLGAGLAGLGLAYWLTWLFDGMRVVAFLPAISGVSVDWRVATFALVVSLLTGMIFSTAPAVISSRVDLLPALKDGVTITRGGKRRLRGSLVAVQVTVSVLLMFGAGLFLRTLQNIRSLDLGMQPDAVVSFGIQPSRFGMSADRSSAYIRDLLERLRHTPGITNAAFTWTTSFSSNRDEGSYARMDAAALEASAAETAVSPGFFETLGMSRIAGRDFTPADLRGESASSGVVIISRSLADTLFPEGGALGSRLRVQHPEGKLVEVVGIVADVRGRAVTQAPEPWAYTPALNPTWGTIQVRSELPAAQVIATIRDVARALDPLVAPHDIETFGTAVDRAISEQRLFARVSSVFAAVAAVLAGIGIYSMLAGAVAERRKEFGIRLALGASARGVIGLVMRSSVVIAAVGLGLGLAGVVALGRLLESRLYGVSRFDPLSMGLAAVAIFALSIIASVLPAIRAARIDPVRSLRVE